MASQAGGEDAAAGGTGVIAFDESKKETHRPSSGFKKLYRRLRASNKVAVNRDDISESVFDDVAVMVFAGPRQKFTSAEMDCIKTYIDTGGSVLIMLAEGGESALDTNINYLTEQYGISVNPDVVLRTVYHKYLHPKESLVSNGVVNKTFGKALNRASSKAGLDGRARTANEAEESKGTDDIDFVYPHGASLSVAKPGVTVLASGHMTYPVNRPVLAVSEVRRTGGRLAVLGSCDMFGDAWLGKEKNSLIQEVLFRWLTKSSSVTIAPAATAEGDVADYTFLPDTTSLAERLRSCLQDHDPLPTDFTRLFDDGLFSFHVDNVPEAVKLYQDLGVKHEPLTVIPPQFDTPLPPLAPAVFPPAMHEPPPPALELFDLDEHFASERIRLAQLTNKCTDGDLDFYLREAGDIVGIIESLPTSKRGAKHVLEFLIRSLVNFKRLTPDPDALKGLALDTAETGKAGSTPSKARNIADVYALDLPAPAVGPAGMRAGAGAGFTRATHDSSDGDASE
ncbi:IFT52 [Symbiodinium sp. KB8]|nr:IFT52 [Symbiodinium sp. KB8]